MAKNARCKLAISAQGGGEDEVVGLVTRDDDDCWAAKIASAKALEGRETINKDRAASRAC